MSGKSLINSVLKAVSKNSKVTLCFDVVLFLSNNNYP